MDLEDELVDVERQIDALASRNPTMAEPLVQLEALCARRYHIKSRLASKPSEQMAWARLEGEATRREKAAKDLLWVDELAAHKQRETVSKEKRAKLREKVAALRIVPVGHTETGT